MAALGWRLRALGRAGGWRGAQSHAGAPRPPPEPPEAAVEESSAEFALVERLLPPSRVPDPPPHARYPTPSGWSPPRDPPPALPYFVRRSRLHNLPVYARLRNGNRRLTDVCRVEGDIWALEAEVRAFLGVQDVQVNEVSGRLRLRGHWAKELREWLLAKGF